MRKMLLRIMASFALVWVLPTGYASAADIPAPVYKAAAPVAVAYNWSGFYGGVHGGYSWSGDNVAIGINDPSGVTQFVAANSGIPLSYSLDRNGYAVGGQVGFNRQMSQWLFGVEADISATGLKASSTVFTPTCPVCGGPNTS